MDRKMLGLCVRVFYMAEENTAGEITMSTK